MEIPPSAEMTIENVLMHTNLHGWEQGAGVKHTQDAMNAMYEFFNNWLSAGKIWAFATQREICNLAVETSAARSLMMEKTG